MSSPSLFEQFVKVCSLDRLSAYRVGNESELDILTRYVWNAALCESFYPVLHSLEVGLRNRLNMVLTTSYGKSQWYSDRLIVRDQLAREKAAEVERLLKHEGKEATPSRVISELSFGFWTRLISANHNRAIWERAGFLKEAFPYMPKRIRKRKTLASRFGEARRLRNRVFHHQPIWRRDLKNDHNNLIEALGWIDPSLQRLTVVLDRFESVWSDIFRQEIRNKLIRSCPVESKRLVLSRKAGLYLSNKKFTED